MVTINSLQVSSNEIGTLSKLILTFASFKRFQLSGILLIIQFSFLTQEKISDSFVQSFFGTTILNEAFSVS